MANSSTSASAGASKYTFQASSPLIWGNTTIPLLFSHSEWKRFSWRQVYCTWYGATWNHQKIMFHHKVSRQLVHDYSLEGPSRIREFAKKQRLGWVTFSIRLMRAGVFLRSRFCRKSWLNPNRILNKKHCFDIKRGYISPGSRSHEPSNHRYHVFQTKWFYSKYFGESTNISILQKLWLCNQWAFMTTLRNYLITISTVSNFKFQFRFFKFISPF